MTKPPGAAESIKSTGRWRCSAPRPLDIYLFVTLQVIWSNIWGSTVKNALRETWHSSTWKPSMFSWSRSSSNVFWSFLLFFFLSSRLVMSLFLFFERVLQRCPQGLSAASRRREAGTPTKCSPWTLLLLPHFAAPSYLWAVCFHWGPLRSHFCCFKGSWRQRHQAGPPPSFTSVPRM